MRTFAAAVIIAPALLAGGATAAHAIRPVTRPATSVGHLVRQHDCVAMTKPMSPPIAGYLIRDTADRRNRLFYKGSGDLTSGMLVSHGGTWELRYKCRR